MVLINTSEGGWGMKILVIDDDVSVARAIERGLRGHTVTIEHDGRSAVETAASALLDGLPFDLVICDRSMPNMNGREVLAELRKQREHPILLLLSGDDASNDNDPVADGVLTKPCRTADILLLFAKIRAARSCACTQRMIRDRAIA
jgi:two-component system copper resistance phosphate regulon response regulator CusR